MSLFANGTEYEVWAASWCARCVHDEPEMGGGCELIGLAMIDEDVPELNRVSTNLAMDAVVVCSKWKGRSE
jgi:hypothetical protein